MQVGDANRACHTPPVTRPALDAAERDRLQRRGLRLEWATIVWNLGEAVITVALGIAAGSIALIAFGLDSLIEVFASAVVVWHVSDLDDLAAGYGEARAWFDELAAEIDIDSLEL